ncbi:hypothetical protein OIO90_000545 [Microbotryomycetes sp. JL221]|nr:hypothetical protein OIO90_000545 [Microbotryomycetes sp. JL221]
MLLDPVQDYSYDAIHKQFGKGIDVPNDLNWPRHVLDAWTKRQPQQIALQWVSTDFSREQTLTYAQLSDLSHRAAVSFEQRGIKKGDKVIMVLGRVTEWWICLFGLMRIGAVPVPGTSLLVGKDLQYRATSAGAIGFIGDKDSCPKFEEIVKHTNVKTIWQVRTHGDSLGQGRRDVQQDIYSVSEGTKYNGNSDSRSSDLALLYFTSGTTGAPKQVLLEQEYLIGHTITGLWYNLKPGMLFSNAADLGWAKAAYSCFGCFNLGASLFVQAPPPGPFTPDTLLKALHKYPIASMCAPPTMYRTLVTKAALETVKREPFKALRHCVSAGEPLNASVITDFQQATGITIKDAWGQTETVIMVGNFEGVKVKPGSMGKVAPSFVMGVLDSEGRELPDGEEGQLAVRSDIGGGSKWIFKGYVKEGKIDKRRINVNQKEWYLTGDRGSRDNEGYFTFKSRDDDVITSSGYRIGPFEVESALKLHPAVLESAAVGSPDLQRLEIVKAFIKLTPEYAQKYKGKSKQEFEALAAEIQAHFRKVTAPYKVPREIEFRETLPTTISGKLQRNLLRAEEQERKKDVLDQIRRGGTKSKL